MATHLFLQSLLVLQVVALHSDRRQIVAWLVVLVALVVAAVHHYSLVMVRKQSSK